MKVAVVVQRYGADINGGAELHARYVAEHLASHVEVEVLTSCAKDYITWKNEWPAGVETVNGITVRRFPVSHERNPREFGDWSTRVFTQPHSLNDELAWLEAEGPASPALVDHIRRESSAYDFFIFFSFRYYHSFYGVRAVASKAILVPTAERDGALGLALFPPIFRGVRALMYNSFEERATIQAAASNESVPGVVVGIGSEIPASTSAGRFRQKFDMRERFAIYVGRIDENKGCRELFDYFEHYSAALVDSLHLVLIGTPVIPIPTHPRIRHLGFVEDQDKFDAIAASELLIMPSYFESLSMVALEAWALGRPVLANAKCDVLQGQCLRSNAGLFYASFQEFFETLRTIDTSPALASALGHNGRAYFERHYSWPVIERKYVDMLDQLSKGAPGAAMEPLPGWFARRRRELAPAEDIVKALPAGPVKAIEGAPRPPRRDLRSPEPPEARPPAQRAPEPSRPNGQRPEGPRVSGLRPSGPRPEGSRPDTRQRRGRLPRRGGRRPPGGGR